MAQLHIPVKIIKKLKVDCLIKVIGVGDNVVDRYIHKGIMYPGGNSVNFPAYAKQLGIDSAYLGVLAKDREAGVITAALNGLSVDISRCVIVDGDRVISDDNDLGAVKATPLQLTDELLDYIKGFDVAHSSCYSFIEDQLFKIRQVGTQVVYDFSDCWKEENILAVCPNIDIAFMSGKSLPDDQIKQVLKMACNLGCRLAIATIGKRGAFIFDGKRYYTKKPYNLQAQVVDTLGAGDSFLTGFVTTYYNGVKLFDQVTEENPGLYTTPEDREDYMSALIEYCMSTGNLLAIKNCMLFGAFGHGVAI